MPLSPDNSYADYLGDAVYAHFDGYHIVLTTGDHNPLKATNTIVLEPTVLAALDRYRENINTLRPITDKVPALETRTSLIDLLVEYIDAAIEAKTDPCTASDGGLQSSIRKSNALEALKNLGN